eukprot:2514521-Amphidinium_carterae.1
MGMNMLLLSTDAASKNRVLENSLRYSLALKDNQIPVCIMCSKLPDMVPRDLPNNMLYGELGRKMHSDTSMAFCSLELCIAHMQNDNSHAFAGIVAQGHLIV